MALDVEMLTVGQIGENTFLVRPQGGDKFIATSWILFQSAQKLFGG